MGPVMHFLRVKAIKLLEAPEIIGCIRISVSRGRWESVAFCRIFGIKQLEPPEIIINITRLGLTT